MRMLATVDSIGLAGTEALAGRDTRIAVAMVCVLIFMALATLRTRHEILGPVH
jgi:hypothetical protein